MPRESTAIAELVSLTQQEPIRGDFGRPLSETVAAPAAAPQGSGYAMASSQPPGSSGPGYPGGGYPPASPSQGHGGQGHSGPGYSGQGPVGPGPSGPYPSAPGPHASGPMGHGGSGQMGPGYGPSGNFPQRPSSNFHAAHPSGALNKPSSRSGVWLALIGILVIGASVGGSYFLAQQQSAGDEEAPVELGLASLETASEVPKGETPKARAAATSDDDEPIGPDNPVTDSNVDQGEGNEVDPNVAQATGFDVMVEPKGARVSLDGQAIGVAPLRVRNLLPGAHRIDIEGPEGYFGRHLEFDLASGEAKVLNLELDSLGDGDSAADEEEDEAVAKSEADDSEDKVDDDKDARLSRKARRKKERRERERKRKERRAELAAAKASEKKSESKVSEKAVKAQMDSADEVSLGTLMLGAKPPCEITINGKPTGMVTPQRSIQLPEGVHKVLLVNEQHGIRKSFKVRIKSGRTTRAIQDLSHQL